MPVMLEPANQVQIIKITDLTDLMVFPVFLQPETFFCLSVLEMELRDLLFDSGFRCKRSLIFFYLTLKEIWAMVWISFQPGVFQTLYCVNISIFSSD